jgi:uncharacterized membrane protein
MGMRATRFEWAIPTSLIVLGIVPALAGTARLVELSGPAQLTAANARFLDQPIPVVLHILTVIPFAFVGAFQFAPGFRRRHRPWHKAAGRVLGVLGLAAALTGLWMALFYPWPAGDGVGVYVERLVFGLMMLASITLALLAVRRRDYKTHGKWMIRGYAIGMGAGTQVLTHLPYFILVGKPGEGWRTILMGSGWVINLLVAEWVIMRNSRPQLRQSGSSAVPMTPSAQPVSLPAGVTYQQPARESITPKT